ncbi:hypothetical protein HDU88_001666 [Geranomyces variabilis]|nr:hypothetical protein HDU88_001666 [Geranomyces variabilis]
MSTLFVPKSRKVRFEASVLLHDMSNLPYVSGLYFVKWKLKNGGTAEGATAKTVVKDHTVTWEQPFPLSLQMVIGKDGVLLPCELVLSVKQTVNAGKSTEDVGMVTLNLAEYAPTGGTSGGGGGAAANGAPGATRSTSTSRRYLLQESRVNSIMRVTVAMKLVKGDATFKVPEITARDLSTEGLRNVFSDHGADNSSLNAFSSLIEDTSMSGDHLRGHSSLEGIDDPNVDLVERLFATSAQTRVT